MKRKLLLVGGFCSLTLSAFGGGCAGSPEPQDLTSLRMSGEATYLCIGPDRTPAPMVDCPIGALTSDGGVTVGKPGFELHALVTQTISAEVAVVRLTGSDSRSESTSGVLDVDASNPGVTPLRVGAQPVAIASTPGGSASFVTVAEPGRTGIFALPTACIFQPEAKEPRRDLTTWPGCRLPTPPGDIAVVVAADEGVEGDGFCHGQPDSFRELDPDASCATNLEQENLPSGRRKLVVALPQEGKLVVIDAQELLNREPGSYDDCAVEAEVALSGVVPGGLTQPLPSDLVQQGRTEMVYPDIEGEYEPRPAGFDLLGGRLLVADRGSPLIHVLDVSDPCAIEEGQPLVAASFNDPARIVTTSRVAQSPETQSGQRFVYAVDEVGGELASVVVFDLSEGEGSRLPLVRPGSPLNPFEAPDRLEFGSAVKDVAFARLERPQRDPAVGEAITGVACNPDPTIDPDSIGARYRSDESGSGAFDDVGASPAVLRGVFGYALLSDGRSMVIDIEDLDAACRRPKSLNPSEALDFRGCQGDPAEFEFYTDDQTEDGTPTVTDEASCRVVVPHRQRSRRYFSTVEGTAIQAPSLQGFAQLSLRGRGLSLSRLTTEGKNHPILLGADFLEPTGSTVPAQVYVGSRLYARDNASNTLEIDPNVAERAAPTLPFVEPRAYPSSELLTVTYEGSLDELRRTGRLSEASDGIAELTDRTGRFCSRGVQGHQLTREMGRSRFGLDGGALNRFTEQHSDYVQITNLLFDESDDYWDGAGASCGEGLTSFDEGGYPLCDSLFRVGDEDELAISRDLTIVSAHDDVLKVTPRVAADPRLALDLDLANDTLEVMRCCFPDGLNYRLRAARQWIVRGQASGLSHPIIEDPEDDEGACIVDPSPLASYRWARAFEVSSSTCENVVADDPDSCGVGPRTPEDVVCAYDSSQGPLKLGGAASGCVYNSLTSRFVVYRGLEPSERDMTFGVQLRGGFEGLAIRLGVNSSFVLPISMTVLPDAGIMGVVDSQNQGLLMVDLARSRVVQAFF